MSIYAENRKKSLETISEFFKEATFDAQSYSTLIESVQDDPTNNFLKSILYEKYLFIMDMAHKKQGAVFEDAANIPAIMELILPNPPEGQEPGDPDIMVSIRDFLNKYDVEIKSGNVATTPHWDTKRSYVRDIVSNFVDPRSVVYFAQSRASGFDHRCLNSAEAKGIVDRKIEAIQASTGIYPFFLDEIVESQYSITQGLIVQGGSYCSTSLLWHARFFISIWKALGDLRDISVIEVGGGFGGLARLMLRSQKVRQYVIADLPESLVSSYAFLRLNFLDLDIQLAATPAEVADKKGADVLLVPSDYLEEMESRKFDLAINTGSIQEMPRSSAERYVSFFENGADIKFFYSLNYSLIQHFRHTETVQTVPGELNLVAPVLDKNWRVRHFYLNPPDILIDTPMNWLEVVLERDAEAADKLMVIPEEKYTQGWFCAIWSNLWKAPSRELIDLYFEGILKFFNGETPHFCQREQASQFDKIGEVVYWRRYLDQQKTNHLN